MASLRVMLRPSCIRRDRVRSPQSGAVRTLLRVDCPPFWTMPSPVPTLCSRKSPNGWIVTLPRAGGTVKAPWLMIVPAGAVVMLRTWQASQPRRVKTWSPRRTSVVADSSSSRGGTLVERMKRANASTSSPVFSGSLTVS